MTDMNLALISMAAGRFRFGVSPVRALFSLRTSDFGLRTSIAAHARRLGVARSTPALLVLLLVLGGMSLSIAAEAPGAAPRRRILLVTGVDYPGHHWRETAPALVQALRKDQRLEVSVVEDPAFLDSAALNGYDAVLLHFQNWEQPGPGQAARDNLRRFVENGKGLLLAHFACGAWYGEWPEFSKLAGRVWAGPGPEVRQHDPFGTFRVTVTATNHPVTRGMAAFETKDELYTCLIGEHPIEVLAEAISKVDGKPYPMAFVSRYGRGRTFHCVLGHDAAALSVPEVQTLFRRAAAWAAGLEP